MTPSEQTEEEIVELKPEETKAVVGGAGHGSTAAAPTAQQTVVATVREIMNAEEMARGGDQMPHRIKQL